MVTESPDTLRPAAGEIVITEIMYDPVEVNDTVGEWFEIYNPTGEQIYLGGCTFRDYGSGLFTIEEDLFIAAGDYLVFYCGEDAESGITSDYMYSHSAFSLSNSRDDEIILSTSEVVIDMVTYDHSLSVPGYSIQLDPAKLNADDNDSMTNWCASTDPIGNGMYGTPGAANTK